MGYLIKSEKLGPSWGFKDLWFLYNGAKDWVDGGLYNHTGTFKDVEVKAYAGHEMPTIISAGNVARAYTCFHPVHLISPGSALSRLWVPEFICLRYTLAVIINATYKDLEPYKKLNPTNKYINDEFRVKAYAEDFAQFEAPDYFFQAVGSGIGIKAAKSVWGKSTQYMASKITGPQIFADVLSGPVDPDVCERVTMIEPPAAERCLKELKKAEGINALPPVGVALRHLQGRMDIDKNAKIMLHITGADLDYIWDNYPITQLSPTKRMWRHELDETIFHSS